MQIVYARSTGLIGVFITCIIAMVQVSAQEAGNILDGVVFHPVMMEGEVSPAIQAAIDQNAAHVQESLRGGAYCKEGLCVQTPPLPTGPANETSDYGAEIDYGNFATLTRRLEACGDAACVQDAMTKSGATFLPGESASGE